MDRGKKRKTVFRRTKKENKRRTIRKKRKSKRRTGKK